MKEFQNLISESFEKDDFQLYKFRGTWLSNISDSKRNNKICLQIHDLGAIFYEIKCIIKRINDDLMKLNSRRDLLDIVDDINLTEEEKDSLIEEHLDLDVFINYLIIDIKSLYVWLLIFLDKIPEMTLTTFQYNQKGIKDDSYNNFIETIKNSEHNRLKELYIIFNVYDEYFQNVRKIRHHYTIHKSKITLPGMTTTQKRDYFSITLSTYKKEYAPIIVLDNELINSHLLLLKSFLRDLNGYLCKNIKEMPFK